MPHTTPKKPIRWIPTLYFMEGLPFTIVMVIATVFYKTIGISNTKNVFYSSLLTLPYFLKPLFAPMLETLTSKKKIIIFSESFIGFLLLLVTSSLFLKSVFSTSLILLSFLAISSAIHDIAADGFFLLNLSLQQQTRYVGLCSLSYQVARFFGHGFSLIVIGFITAYLSLFNSWQCIFLLFSLIFFLIAFYHHHILPESEIIPFNAAAITDFPTIKSLWLHIYKKWMDLPHIGFIIFFILIYNAQEAQLLKIMPLFLLDPETVGGFGLSTSQVGLLSGTLGVVSLMFGAMTGSLLLTYFSLRPFLMAMSVFTVLSNMNYLFLIQYKHPSFLLLSFIIILTQWIYGVSTTAFLSYLFSLVDGKEYRMSLYAIATSLMLLGITGFASISGFVQGILGYHYFFMWIIGLGICIASYTAYFLRKTALQENPSRDRKGVSTSIDA